MKEYNDKGIKFNYKEGLNEGDFVALVESYINAYNNGIAGNKDEIEGLHKNPIIAERVFNINLGNLCIENFSNELHEQVFEKGIYSFLRENIYNAKEAYNLAKEVCKRVDSIDELAYRLFNKMIELIPSDIDIKELQDAWDKVSKEYKDIVKE